MNIRDELFALQDKGYAEFQAKLTPTVPADKFIGVRVPKARALAKRLYKENRYHDFIGTLPHDYYDENMLHGLIISLEKDYDTCISLVDSFLPHVDNWAVCDTMSPVCFKKNRHRLIEKVKEWSGSDDDYTCRFGIGMLMAHYLDETFRAEYLEIPAHIVSDEYYVNMMRAWFYATALAKQWDATLPYISEQRLDKWTHNKTIQKARESLRITKEQKDLLKNMKL